VPLPEGSVAEKADKRIILRQRVKQKDEGKTVNDES